MNDNPILDYKFDDESITEVHMFMGQRVAIYCDGHIQLCEADVIALASHYNISQQQIWDYEAKSEGDL